MNVKRGFELMGPRSEFSLHVKPHGDAAAPGRRRDPVESYRRERERAALEAANLCVAKMADFIDDLIEGVLAERRRHGPDLLAI